MKSKALTHEIVKEADILKELTQLLNHTLETEGQVLWAKLFQEKTAHDGPTNQIAVSFEEAKLALGGLLKEVAKKPIKGKLNVALKLGVQSTALFSSAFLGLILPQNDVILFKKDQKQDAITLERASLFISELFLDWMDAILSRAEENSTTIENLAIRLELKNHLELTRKLTQNAKAGLKRGSNLRNRTTQALYKIFKTQRKEIRIPMESRAFLALEGFLNQTLKTK
ncbi:hypothetical protein EBQ74_00240 [bacterium]|nr:hypothetical protein [bacterium]